MGKKVLIDSELLEKLLVQADDYMGFEVQAALECTQVAVFYHESSKGWEHLVFDSFEKAVAKAEEASKGADASVCDISNVAGSLWSFTFMGEDGDHNFILVAMMDIE